MANLGEYSRRMSDNPYVPPASENLLTEQPSIAPQSLGEIARITFLVWEKLRLVYVSVLAAEVLFMAATHPDSYRRQIVDFWLIVAFCAVIANLCYFAGPVTETYVTWLGYRGGWLRIVLFVLGTLFACALALGVLAGALLPGMD
jgi:hypothetical protein